MVISGTGTGVGKTVATAAVAALACERDAAVAVVKAAQTGVTDAAPGDLDEVRRLCGPDARLTLVEGARFPDPLSPAAAARLSGRPPVDLRGLASTVRELAADHPLVLVEGAGGLLVRFDEEGATVAGLAAELAAPVLVVADPGLGTLNATALTLEAMAHRGLELAGVVLGTWPAGYDTARASNVADLEMLGARPLAGALLAGLAGLDPADFREAARAALGPALGGRFDAAAFRAQAADALSRRTLSP